MRYLKSFNEKKNYQEIFSDVKELCEESLVYLLDDPSYNLEFFSIQNNLSIVFLKKEKSQPWPAGSFSWDDIKNDYIPFIEMLSSKYNIHALERTDKEVSITYLKEYLERDGSAPPKKVFRQEGKDYTLEEILNDEVNIENLIRIKVILEF
jgi:hypothetical protein